MTLIGACNSGQAFREYTRANSYSAVINMLREREKEGGREREDSREGLITREMQIEKGSQRS